MSTPLPLTVIDLFCGAGGMSLGFTKAGFDLVFAADNNASAVETYNKNFTHRARQLDLSLHSVFPSASVIVGGPPCQGFSSAGARRKNDPRNTLVSKFANIIANIRPAAFIFENVEGFLTGEGGAHVLELLNPLLAVGYRIHLKKVNMANYGVPQHRKRVLAIGGLGWDPTFPESTNSSFGAPGAARTCRNLPLSPTVSEGLRGLPEARLEPNGYPQGHNYKALSAIALARAEQLLPGMTMRDLPDAFRHGSYLRRANRRVSDGTPSEQRGGAPAGIRRLAPDEPSKAITSGARTEFLHPTENRTLTLRECARLQTFEDDFEFLGSSAEQAVLIGNAVPPVFASRIAQSLKTDLESIPQKRLPGGLLSFVPTSSAGMSPALQKTTRMVASQAQLLDAQEVFPFGFI